MVLNPGVPFAEQSLDLFGERAQDQGMTTTTFTTTTEAGATVHHHDHGAVAITKGLALSSSPASSTWCFAPLASDFNEDEFKTGFEVAASAIVQGF